MERKRTKVSVADLKQVNDSRMLREAKIDNALRQLRGLSPRGFAIALHVKFTSPRYLFQAYDKEWLDLYSREGLVLSDPTIPWAFSNIGTIRWSELAPLDSAGLFARAASHGLTYGVTVGVRGGASHSMASFCRPDREYTADEAGQVEAAVQLMHDMTLNASIQTPALHNTLRQLSIFLTRG
jgi:LuxR family transcriptional regulator